MIKERVLDFQVAPVFQPLLDQSARYLGAHGGRASAKSWFMSGRVVRRASRTPGARIVCLREVQRDLKDSAKVLIEDTIRRHQAPNFTIRRDDIGTPGGGVIIFRGMRDYTAESIKSLEGFDMAWIEEAHTLSQKSLDMLRPTMFRKSGAQILASWNPTRKSDAIDAFLRKNRPDDAAVVQSNYLDNPWFPEGSEKERAYDELHAANYRHKWLGDYATVTEGAYYARELTSARSQGRIGRVSPDPLQAYRIFCDLGGSSQRADAFAMWVTQFLGREIRVLNYYEAIGQPAQAHFNWLRENGYEGAHIVLPHDGTQQHGPNPTTWETAFKSADWPKVRVVRNQGAGAALQRIQAARRVFPSVWFNEATTEPGREALGAYHEHKDETRQVGLGPVHDWSSHGADAFGLMCLDYEPPRANIQETATEVWTESGDANAGWMR